MGCEAVMSCQEAPPSLEHHCVTHVACSTVRGSLGCTDKKEAPRPRPYAWEVGGGPEAVQLAPAFLQRIEGGVDLCVIAHIAGKHEVGADRGGQRAHPLFQRLTLEGEGKLRPLGSAGLGDGPGD